MDVRVDPVSSSSEVDTYIVKYMASLKTTAAARFNAARRLEGRSRAVNLMLALLSSSVIVTSVLPVTVEFDKPLELLIFFVGLAASIFVVVLSLYQWSSRDDVNAERLHRAGMKISELRRQVKLNYLARTDPSKPAPLDDWLESAVEQYSDILRECGVNHEDVDYTRVKIEIEREQNRSWLISPRYWLTIMTNQIPPLAAISFIIFLVVLLVICIAFAEIIRLPNNQPILTPDQARIETLK
jgi:hypothetical protein